MSSFPSKRLAGAFIPAIILLLTTVCFGQTGMAINNADNAWVLIAAALVLFMTPGLAFFYGGLVRKKNVLSILIQCFILICLVSIQWVVFGYSLAFGPDIHGLIGSLKWIGLNDVGLTPNPDYAATIPHQTFMIFQAMFAIITPALILGAFAERMKFGAFVLFSLLWSFLVYDPVCHWVWGAGGFLRALGALDFAAASSSTSTREWRPSRRRSSWDEDTDILPASRRRITFPSRSSARESSGSAGSGSTPAVR